MCKVPVIIPEEGKSPLGRHWRSWGGGGLMVDLKELGRKGEDCIHVAQDTVKWRALVNTVTKLGVPQKTGNSLTR